MELVSVLLIFYFHSCFQESGNVMKELEKRLDDLSKVNLSRYKFSLEGGLLLYYRYRMNLFILFQFPLLGFIYIDK